MGPCESYTTSLTCNGNMAKSFAAIAISPWNRGEKNIKDSKKNNTSVSHLEGNNVRLKHPLVKAFWKNKNTKTHKLTYITFTV